MRKTATTATKERYLSAKECAEFLNIGISTARKFAKEIGAEKKIGTRCVYDKKAIEAYLDENNTVSLPKRAENKTA